MKYTLRRRTLNVYVDEDTRQRIAALRVTIPGFNFSDLVRTAVKERYDAVLASISAGTEGLQP